MGGELDKLEEKGPIQLNTKKFKSAFQKVISNIKTEQARKKTVIQGRSLIRKDKIKVPSNYPSFNKELTMMTLIQEKNPEKIDYDLINNCISKHYFMQSLKNHERNEIIVNMSLYKVRPHTTLYYQGAFGNYWFIVHTGELEFFVDGVKKATYRKGDNFGEIALMNNCPRNGTVKAITECELWALDREDFENIKEYLYKISFRENMQFLKSLKIPLGDEVKSNMANYLVKNIYKARDTIYKQGDISSCIYIIKEGEVNFLVNNQLVRTKKRSEYFGQNGLFEGHRRETDAIAKTNCVIFTISNDFFQNQFGEDFKDQLYFSLLKISLLQSHNFKTINASILNKAFKFFKFRSVRKGTVIYRKGTEMHKKMCVILEGNVIDKGTNKVEGKTYELLFEDNVVNEKELKLQNDLVANSNCIIAEANYDDVKVVLGGDIKVAKEVSHALNAIDNIKLFRNLNAAKKEIIQKNLKVEKFSSGQKIILQGSIGDKLYIVKKGKVDFLFDNKYMKSLFEGDDFGSKSLILSDRKSLSTIVANGPVECYTLSANIFNSILNPQLKEYFMKQYYFNDYSIELEDLENIKLLGEGSYGFVNLVRSKKNKQLYAAKALDLIQIKEENILTRVETEKNTLLKMDHPFIAKTVKYIKGDIYLYYIMEYVRGKELFDVMRDINLLNKPQTQFYGASMLEVLNYLHGQRIIYRDLKPENIMVLENGYIKFFDFGTVKLIRDRCKTFIGTTSYMAPEIFTGNGYSFQVDMWALGVVMYEFVCGQLPFGEDIEDPMEFYNVMIKQNLNFPPFVNDHLFKDLIQKLLIKDPNKRLSQYMKIREHPYFKDFDWEKLISLDLKAPYTYKLHDIIPLNSNMMYLDYLHSLGNIPLYKRKQSVRQVKFNKWLKNF